MRFAWIALPPSALCFALAFASASGCSSSSSQASSADGGLDATTDATTADGGADGADGGFSPDVNADVEDPLVVAVNDFCNAAYATVLTPFAACCSATDKQTNEYQDIDNSYMAAASDCTIDLTASIIGMRATFDMNGTAACLQQLQGTWGKKLCWPQIATNRPSPPFFASSDCTGVIKGLQGSGQPCSDDYECQDGLACVGETDTQDGTCQAAAATGKACGPGNCSSCGIPWGFGTHTACGPGMFCGGGTCQAQGAAGQGCTDVPSGQCTGTLVCAGGQCATAYSGDGGPCVGIADCQDGLTCLTGAEGGAGTCQPRAVAGLPCSTDDQCQGYCELDDAGSSTGSMDGSCATLCGSH